MADQEGMADETPTRPEDALLDLIAEIISEKLWRSYTGEKRTRISAHKPQLGSARRSRSREPEREAKLCPRH